MVDQMAVENKKSSSFEKRVKRRVTGRVHAFFAATAPGLEELCLSELLTLPLSEKQARAVPGGVEFEGRLHDCYLANLHLRTANRVLIRIAEFRASGFPALEKRLAEIDWELFLPPAGSLRVSAASSKSRLYHRGAVAQRVRDSVETVMGYGGRETTGPEIRIFIRGESDRFTVSLDSTGGLLHKRGVKSQGGKAPIRETLAAAILKMAGYRPGQLLVDPMCGSGTFSLEAAMISRNLPPGWMRGFAFQEWPAFSPGRWRHLRREAEAALRAPGQCIFASDAADGTLLALEEQLSAGGLSELVTISRNDFFDLTPAVILNAIEGGNSIPRKPGLIVLNPPYGRRLGSSSEAKQLFAGIMEKLRNDFDGWRVAILVPKSLVGKRTAAFLNETPFFHGGLDLVLLTGKIQF